MASSIYEEQKKKFREFNDWTKGLRGICSRLMYYPIG